jgi:hypothetical protein
MFRRSHLLLAVLAVVAGGLLLGQELQEHRNSTPPVHKPAVVEPEKPSPNDTFGYGTGVGQDVPARAKHRPGR